MKGIMDKYLDPSTSDYKARAQQSINQLLDAAIPYDEYFRPIQNGISNEFNGRRFVAMLVDEAVDIKEPSPKPRFSLREAMKLNANFVECVLRKSHFYRIGGVI